MAGSISNKAEPLYSQIKRHILQRIDQGEWVSGTRIPSENELVLQFGASRMTVSRALRDLVSDGKLARTQGVGTFVTTPPAKNDLLEIRDIALDIVARGLAHRARLVCLEAVRADTDLAITLDLRPGAKVFHSIIVHFEDDLPIQLEERYVSPRFAPDYLQQDFTTQTTTHYLQSISGASEVEHMVFAISPDEPCQRLLEIAAGDPCLLLMRRTWSNGIPATKSFFTYPGSRFSLGTRYKVQS
jgi:GntR family histidine utilization transcriptional repressor